VLSLRHFAPFDFAHGAGQSDLTTNKNKMTARHAPDPWFGKDKAQHFVVSFLTTGAVSYSAQHRWNRDRSQGVKWGLALSLSLGICKEIRDLRHPGSRASVRDLAADLLGSACGALLVSWW
jgi:putative lipoprotein